MRDWAEKLGLFHPLTGFNLRTDKRCTFQDLTGQKKMRGNGVGGKTS
jgi:hypothetical protein